VPNSLLEIGGFARDTYWDGRACPDVTHLSQASAEQFQQCAEFLLLRNRGLGPLAVFLLAVPLAGRTASTHAYRLPDRVATRSVCELEGDHAGDDEGGAEPARETAGVTEKPHPYQESPSGADAGPNPIGGAERNVPLGVAVRTGLSKPSVGMRPSSSAP